MRPTIEKGILYKVNCHLAIQAFLGTDWDGFPSHHHFVFGYVGGSFYDMEEKQFLRIHSIVAKIARICISSPTVLIKT